MSRTPASKIRWNSRIKRILTYIFSVLSPTEEDIQLLLSAQCHIGTKNANVRMAPYIYKRRADGN